MTWKIALSASAALALAMPVSPAAAQDNDSNDRLVARVEQLSARVAELESALARGRAGAAAAPQAPAADGQAVAAAPPAPAPTLVARASGAPAGPLDRALQGGGAEPGARAAFELNAASDSSQVSIRLASTVSNPNLRGGNTGTGTYTTWSLTGSAPVSRSGPRTDLATLDGFANSFTVRARWSQFRQPLGRNDVREAEIKRTARDNCLRQAGSEQPRIQACNASIIDDGFIRTHAPDLHNEYLRLGFPNRAAVAFGVEGSIGYRKFDFVDVATASRSSLERVPWGARAFVSVLPPSSLLSITGSLEYQRSYQEQQAGTLCPANPTSAAVLCLNGPIGAPRGNDKLLAALEIRNQFNLGERSFLRSIGVSAQFTYDAHSDVFGIDLPIYFVPDAQGRLIGGVRFGYRTDQDNLMVGIFVGSTFSIF